MKLVKINILLIFFLSLLTSIEAQEAKYNPVQVAVPSLMIGPDARAGGMADVGAATAPDVYSQYWNVAKYAFTTKQKSVAFSYAPWLDKISDDVALMNVVGYFKIGKSDNQALSASFTYFKYGDIDMRDPSGNYQNTLSPNEMSFDIGYSRKLTNTFSMGVALRYIRADYSNGENGISSGDAFSADIAGYNESYVMLGSSEALLGFGFNISNIGSKLSKDEIDGCRFIPANLRLGTSLLYPISEKHSITGSLDLNKLLVPTPPNPNDNNFEEEYKDYLDRGSISGIFKSFSDAPGGFSEELKEINWSIGAEYNYDNLLKIRTGYHNEHSMKGNRKYLTFGAGVNISAFQLDASYLVGTSQNNPMDQMFRLSLAFDIDKVAGFFNR